MSTTAAASILALVPSTEIRPEKAEPSRFARGRGGISRRSVLRIAGGTAIATGLASLDLLPWSKPQAAFANFTEWSTCSGYFSNGTDVCVPTTALYTGNCQGSWHSNLGASGSGYNYKYTPDYDRCSGKNAWRWTGSGNHRKCSDGDYEYTAQGSSTIYRTSICRTAI